MDGTNTYMPVMPANNGGFDMGGGWWIILLFLFMGFGGGFGGFGNNNAAGFANADLQRGFDQNSIMGGINGIQATLNSSQMADLNRSFDVQTSVMQGFNGIQAQLAQCCCDNRAATADLKYTVATEACADRSAISDALQRVIAENTASTQKILDRMCQQEIDALKARNIELQNQVNLQALAASQTAQTAALVADNTAQTQYIVNRVAPYPIPAYTVANPVTPAA